VDLETGLYVGVGYSTKLEMDAFKKAMNMVKDFGISAFSADKRRFGWVLRQKREDRQEMAMFSIALLHNFFTICVVFQ